MESDVLLCKLDTAMRAAKVEKSGCFCDMYAQVSAAKVSTSDVEMPL
eukprot:CAMPEP_0176170950 /NCGR_PEP_ID=MMETSP0120_2-20121206/87514_1 /TAXON_ID=160619 /ORGANISM="Kryptoperidinium foliaceum, Strain CCMP 1326" /LENGTH=46 /DNA_ID= /DNA_START= /DNA_END= /DNA_ORIENTATION=